MKAQAKEDVTAISALRDPSVAMDILQGPPCPCCLYARPEFRHRCPPVKERDEVLYPCFLLDEQNPEETEERIIKYLQEM